MKKEPNSIKFMEYKMDCKSEEDVKVKVVLPYLNKLGYSLDQMEFEKTIEVNEGVSMLTSLSIRAKRKILPSL